MNRSLAILVLVALSAASASFVIFKMSERSQWPSSGFKKFVDLADMTEFWFDCYPSQWMKENPISPPDAAVIGNVEGRDGCSPLSGVLNVEAFENVLNITFRCDQGQVFREYSVQIFRRSDTGYGDYHCNSAYTISSEALELGEITEVMTTPY